VLVEAVALLLVVSIGVTAVVATVSRAYAAARQQMAVTAATIQEGNELARTHMAQGIETGTR
jgi:Tfp pilus assembly protein PilV